jgi:hypothetical protein
MGEPLRHWRWCIQIVTALTSSPIRLTRYQRDQTPEGAGQGRTTSRPLTPVRPPRQRTMKREADTGCCNFAPVAIGVTTSESSSRMLCPIRAPSRTLLQAISA